MLRRREPQIEHRHERLAAGKQTRILVLPQKRQRLIETMRAMIGEGGRLHAAPPGRCAARIKARSRGGVTGNSRTRTPKGRSASSIAETIAAGAAIVPLSAAPLTPSGFIGVGVSI